MTINSKAEQHPAKRPRPQKHVSLPVNYNQAESKFNDENSHPNMLGSNTHSDKKILRDHALAQLRRTPSITFDLVQNSPEYDSRQTPQSRQLTQATTNQKSTIIISPQTVIKEI